MVLLADRHCSHFIIAGSKYKFDPACPINEPLLQHEENFPSGPGDYYSREGQRIEAYQQAHLLSVPRRKFKWNPFKKEKGSSSSSTIVQSSVAEPVSSSVGPDEGIEHDTPEIIDPDAVMPRGLIVVGKAEMPAQKPFKKIFAHKKVQLRLAMKHGELIRHIASDISNEDGQLYLRATEALMELYPEAKKVDAFINGYFENEGMFVPSLKEFTMLKYAPHKCIEKYKAMKSSVAQKAAMEARRLGSVAGSLKLSII